VKLEFGLSGSGNAFVPCASADAMGLSAVAARNRKANASRLRDNRQFQWPDGFERLANPATDLVAHRTRDADAPRRALGLQSHRDVDCVPMPISFIRNCIAYIDPHAKPDVAGRRHISELDAG
jgi:hypothetical protein